MFLYISVDFKSGKVYPRTTNVFISQPLFISTKLILILSKSHFQYL